MTKYFLDVSYSDTVGYQCILTEDQRDKYLGEISSRDSSHSLTIYNDDDEIECEITGDDIVRDLENAKVITDAEADTLMKFIPSIHTEYLLVETWCDSHDDSHRV